MMKKLVSLLLIAAITASIFVNAFAGAAGAAGIAGNHPITPDSTADYLTADITADGFVHGEVLVKADSQEQASLLAVTYNAQLKSYAYGVAVLSVPDSESAVRQSSMSRTLMPKLSLNRIYKTAIIKREDVPEGYVMSPDGKQWRSPDGGSVIYRSEHEPKQPVPIAIQGQPNDDDFYLQYFHEDVDSVRAWDITKGSASVVVAVIDTGIDTDHPEFAGRISAKSYNAHTDQVGLQYVRDDDGHGTQVSGILAASQNNLNGGSGVAPGVTIMSIKANIPETDTFDTASMVRGINYAVDNGASVINMSLGRSYSSGMNDLENDAIHYATESGVVVVCAAGNESENHASYPAAYTDAVAVSALIQNGLFEFGYSNRGPEIDVAAPGTAIYTTFPGGYTTSNGTSLASPIVAGIAALIKSVNPGYTAEQVKEAIYSGAREGGLIGKDDFYGYGAVSAYSSLVASNTLRTVTYHINDDQADDVHIKSADDAKLIKPTPTGRDGYTFTGWYKDRGFTQIFDYSSETVASDLSLFARWIQGEAESPAEDFELIYVSDDEESHMIRYIGFSDTVVVPQSIEGCRINGVFCAGFISRDYIKRVVLQQGIEYIDTHVFANNLNLESVVLPSSLKLIDDAAFFNCPKLDLDIPSGTNVGDLALDKTKWYDRQPSGMIYINSTAYHYKGDLLAGTQVVLRDGVISVNGFVFNKRDVDVYGGFYMVSTMVIFEEALLSSLVLPNSIETLNDSAFSNCTKLKNVIIPNSVKSIGEYAFAHCGMLSSIYFDGDAPEVGGNAFYYCAFGAKAYVRPEAKGFTENGYFWNGLIVEDGENVGDIFVSDGILYKVLLEDGDIGRVQVGIGVEGVNAIQADSTRIVPIQPSVTYKGKTYTVESISDWAFSDCDELERVIIPNSVTSIGEYSFAYCDRLSSIYFDGDAPSVGWNAFYNIAFGAKAYIHPEAKRFTENGYLWNELIVEYSENVGDIFISDGILYKVLVEEGNIGSVQVGLGEWEFRAISTETTGIVSIPPSVTNGGKTYTVESIGDWAFSDCGALESVVIPNSVTSIGECAFINCGMLESIYFDGDAPGVGWDAFSDVAFGAIAYVHPEAKGFAENGYFWNGLIVVDGENAGDIFISDGILYKVLSEDGDSGSVQVGVGEENANAIRRYTTGIVSIPSSVTNGGKTYTVESIGDWAFYRCGALESVLIPNSVKHIGNWGFASCWALERVMIPNSVTSIGEYAFAFCNVLTSVTIPDSVTNIGEYAFAYCGMLSSIYFDGDAPSVAWYAFYYIAFGAKAYVHPEAKGFTENGYFWNGLIVVDGENAGDIFISDGILYKVLSEDGDNGSVQVGAGEWGFPAISTETTGIVSIPPSVTNGGKTYTEIGRASCRERV